MKNFKKVLAAGLLALTFGLTACGKVSQSYADKINAAAKTEKTSDDYKLSKIERDLGEGTGILLNGSGIKTWTTKDKDGKVVATLTITFANEVAILAVYVE